MLNAKTLHLFGKVLASRPLDLPDMVRRRLNEATHIAPRDGLARTHFGDVSYAVDMGLHGITRKYYFQTHEMFLERIFREHLRPGSIFVDIGANMGYWSAFAAMLVGPAGAIHAFEPVPRFFASIARLRDDNPVYAIHANNMAVGAAPGGTTMQVVAPCADNYENFDINIGSSSALPGFLDHAAALTTSIEVPVTSFDIYARNTGLNIERIGLIKIDVEGFESYVFDGMKNLLEKPGRKVPILCEILTDPGRHDKLDGRKIIARLRDHGYRVLDTTTLKPIDPNRLAYEENILCL